MQMLSRFETKLFALLADLEWRVRLLDSDITAEEERTKVHDVSSPDYSLLGRNFSVRRDNLLTTIAILKRQLEERQAA